MSERLCGNCIQEATPDPLLEGCKKLVDWCACGNLTCEDLDGIAEVANRLQDEFKKRRVT